MKVGKTDGDPVGLIGVPVGQTGAALGAALGLDVGVVLGVAVGAALGLDVGVALGEALGGPALIVGAVKGVSGHTGFSVGA